jgi:hypothetical protein
MFRGGVRWSEAKRGHSGFPDKRGWGSQNGFGRRSGSGRARCCFGEVIKVGKLRYLNSQFKVSDSILFILLLNEIPIIARVKSLKILKILDTSMSKHAGISVARFVNSDAWNETPGGIECHG